MRSKHVVSAAVALATALAAGACGSKDATGPNIALSLEEIGTLGQELGNVLGPVIPLSPPARGGAPFRTGLVRLLRASIPVNGTSTCPGGGTGSIAATVDTTATTATATATFTYSSCRTAHYTTTGSFQATGNASWTQTTNHLQATAGGTLTVSTLDGRSGACPIDVTVDLTQTGAATPVYVVSGSACGVKLTGTY